MSRQEDFDNQSEKYVDERKSFGVNDPYVLKEIGEAHYQGAEYGYQHAVEKACEWLRTHLGAPEGIPQAKAYEDAMNELISEFRKSMEE